MERNKQRESNIELYRIVLMLLIIAHHYVVNSGLIDIMYKNTLSSKSIYLFLFGGWGKIGINCFLLITGYFMCKSKATIEKFLKLLLEVEFYKIVIYLLFTIFGVVEFDKNGLINTILPLRTVAQNFTGCYLLFYLLINYINKLIENLNKKELGSLIVIMFFIYSVLENVLKMNVVMNYITLYIYIYLIGAYIRLYPFKWFENKKIVSIITLLCICMCMLSIVYCLHIGKDAYYYVADSNKILAVFTSISLFLFFKNLNLKYNKFINTTAMSIFGVLQIHANSDTMRYFLWNTTLNNVKMYDSEYIFIHAIISVIGVFIICTILDQIRIRLIEKTLFEKINKIRKNKTLEN